MIMFLFFRTSDPGTRRSGWTRKDADSPLGTSSRTNVITDRYGRSVGGAEDIFIIKNI